MEYDFLKDYALKNIWGAPGQDTQYIVKPQRLTPQHGATRNFKVALQPLGLPDTTSRWHVYQIGGIHPLVFNLFAKCYEWVPLSDACNQKKMIAQVYGDSGVVLPNYKTYYRYTSDQNLIMAVMIDSKIPLNPNVEAVYLRVYSNSYYESPRWTNAPGQPLQYGGRTLETSQQRTTVQNLYTTWAARPGHTWLYVNGLVRNSWAAAPINVGDCVELVYDPSVYLKLHLKIEDLPVFDSILDFKRKYLIHYAGAGEPHIDFQDDIDVFVTRVVSPDYQQSLYLTKNNEDALRNVTHRDYSVPTTYVRRYMDTFELQTIPRAQYDELDAYLDVYVRRAGFDRPLVFETNRIHELYKLADADIRAAMLGIDSVVTNFRADTLEAAMYPAIMRMHCHDVTNPVVENALGYNAISKAIADTPQATATESGRQVVNVPYKLMWGSTAYEYDEDGILLGFYHHYVGSKYTCANNNARYVELIAGLGSEVLDERYDVQTMPFNPNHSYRVYECRQYGGAPDNIYTNVTGSGKYTLLNGQMTWVDTSPTSYVMVRSDARFLAYDLELTMESGLLEFPLMHVQNRNGVLTKRVMNIGLGQIDVFLNGKSLIRGLDYFVSFPHVHIVSKEHLIEPLSEPQKIHVRFCGFGDQQDRLLPEGDTGFVEHGLLSNNFRFDLRDDRVLRIIVDGQLKTRADFTFSELHNGVAPIDPRNGAPYMVKGVLVPVKSQTTTDTYGLRAISEDIDKRVGDYMTLKLPQPPRGAPSAIPDRYRLFSPFCNALIFDLKYLRLRLTQKPGGYTRQQVIETCKRYEHLLRFDPTQVENEQDLRYVVIEPHCLGHIVELMQYEYQFMHQVIEVYTRGTVVMSGFVRMLNNP